MENKTNETTMSAIEEIKNDLDKVISYTDSAKDSIDAILDDLDSLGLLTDGFSKTMESVNAGLDVVLSVVRLQFDSLNELEREAKELGVEVNQ